MPTAFSPALRAPRYSMLPVKSPQSGVGEYDSTGALKRQEVESRRANRSFC